VKLQEEFKGEDITVVIHDGNRPMVSADLISDCIRTAALYGSGVAASPCHEAVFSTEDRAPSKTLLNRDLLLRTQTPHAFSLKKLLNAHAEGEKRGITASVASCTLLAELGGEVHFSLGSELNLKITTKEDLLIFKALLKAKDVD
jgi:2-C-methyl-D-erythritol 4-phosphate cytidylyltransferase